VGQVIPRLDSDATPHDFEVQVRTGRTTGRTHRGDRLLRHHQVARTDEKPGGVPVQRRETVAVIDHDRVAIGAAGAGGDDPPAGAGENRRARRCSEVEAFVAGRSARERVATRAEARARPSCPDGPSAGKSHAREIVLEGEVRQVCDHGFEPRQLFLESRQTRAEIAVAGEASSWPRTVPAEWNEWATTRQRIAWAQSRFA
jgi:hypothetical protein